MKIPRIGVAALLMAVAAIAHAVFDQSIAVAGSKSHELAGSTITFTSVSGQQVDVEVEPGDAAGSGTQLRLRYPTGTAAEAGKLVIRRMDGSATTYALPAATASQRITINLDLGRVMVEGVAAVIHAATTNVTFLPPPPFSGPLVRWGAETLSEDDRAALEQLAGMTDAEADARAVAAGEAFAAQQQLQLKQSAAERLAAEEKALEYAHAHKIDGMKELTVWCTVGEDGRYEGIQLWYGNAVNRIQYVATFDGEGNLLTPPTQTASGKAQQNANAHKPAHVTGGTWRSDRDINGATFLSRIDYGSGGGYLLFNEHGIAYKGEFFDKNGVRTGGFFYESLLPQYGDPRGFLPPKDLQRIATSPCPECQDEVEHYNAIANDMNQIAREMNDLSRQHRGKHEAANRVEDYSQELPPLRLRYEHLAGVWTQKAVELAAALAALLACAQDCGGDVADEAVLCGADCDAATNPFDESADAQLAGADVDVADDDPGDFDERFCTYLSQPAQTIACSVHTSERAHTCSGSNANPDWRYGACTASGDGIDAEVFVRNPFDNNLRHGCGDLDSHLLAAQLDPFYKNREVRVVAIACNRFAAEAGANTGGIVRGHRDQLYVDTSDRKKADYERAERRRNVNMSSASQHLVIRGVVSDAMAAPGRCPPPKKPEDPLTFNDPKFEVLPDRVKSGAAHLVQVYRRENADQVTQGVIGLLGDANKTQQTLGVTDKRLNRAAGTADMAYLLSDGVVRVMSREGLTLDDAKRALDNAAAISNSKALGTVGKGFAVLQKLKELKLKKDQGLPIETKDIKELVDALEEVRGERFEGLGEVLKGISKGASTITQGEAVIGDLLKVWDMMKPGAESIQDPVKAFEAFADYLGILAKLAGYVPGMGEFVTKYAEAVQSMQASVEAIAAAADRRNAAMAMWKEAVEGYNYPLLMQDAAQFEQDLDAPAGGGEQLTADQINFNRAVADERAALESAERALVGDARCVERLSMQIFELKADYELMRQRYSSLPRAAALERGVQNAAMAAQLLGIKDSLTLSDARNMGANSVAEAKRKLDELTPKSADAALTKAASDRDFKNAAVANAADMRARIQQLLKKLQECRDRLQTSERAFWQAMRDFAAAYSYFNVLATEQGNTAAADEKRKQALAAIDQQIREAGFAVKGTRVEVIVVSECDEKKTAVMVGR